MYSKSPFERRALASLRAFCVLVALSLIAVPALVSCSSEPEEEPKKASSSRKKKSSKKKSGSSSSRKKKESKSRDSNELAIQETVEQLVARAKKIGASKAFADDYRAARKQQTRGENYLDEDETKKARTAFERAERDLERLLKDYADYEKKLKSAKALIAKIEEEKTKAEEAGAPETAEVDYEDAVSTFEAAQKELADATPETIEEIESELENAKMLFADAVEFAGEAAKTKKRALAEQATMTLYKKQAEDSGANSKALSDWLAAGQVERDAASHFEEGNFDAAVTTYQQAAAAYIRALENTVSKAEMAAFMAQAAKERERMLEHEKEMEKQRLASAEKIATEKASAIAKLGGRPGSGTYVPPAGGSSGDIEADMRRQAAAAQMTTLAGEFEATRYPQELDAEDEEFLREHYQLLSKELHYDPDSGIAFIDYTNGGRMLADLGSHRLTKRVIKNLRDKKYLQFQNPLTPDAGESQSFQGNTKGVFYIPVPFKYRVRVEWDMAIQTMDANGSFNCIVMYDPEKRNSYMTEWIHWRYSVGGGRPKSLLEFDEFKGRSANYWFNKTKDVKMLVEYAMPGAAIDNPDPTIEDLMSSAKMTCVYDRGFDEKKNEYVSEKPFQTGGLVGFKWSRSKFTFKGLRIAGILDKPTAVKMLRRQTGKKKTGSTITGKKSGEKDPEDSGDGDGEKKPITDPKEGFGF